MKHKFKIIELHEPTDSEKGYFNLIYFIVFGGFFVGMLINSFAFSIISIIVGAFGMLILNHLTNGKFQADKAIKHNEFISFSEEIIIINKELLKWEELKQIKINIVTYKGMSYTKHNRQYKYKGIEFNHIEFENQGEIRRIDFFIEDKNSYDVLVKIFSQFILPKLYSLKNIKNESLIIAKLGYTELQKFKKEYDINRYTDFIYFE